MKNIFLIALVLGPCTMFGQTGRSLPWFAFEDGKYVAWNEASEAPNTVYLMLSKEIRNHRLKIESTKPFFVFVNGKVAGEFKGAVAFNTDSLWNAYPVKKLILAVHQRSLNERDLSTQLIGTNPTFSDEEDLAKRPTYFKDFVVVTGLLLVIYFVVIARTNPKLTGDYLSVTKMLSLRESDDVQANARLMNSANLQFYLCSSMLLALTLSMIFQHLPDRFAIPGKFESTSFWSSAGQWFMLTLVIVGLFFAKSILIFLSTRLFGLEGFARIHLFNWMRLMLLFCGALSVIIFVYFIWRNNNPEVFLFFLNAITVALALWVVLVFLKLNGRSEHSMFHLFSYICATEIIPLLIISRVLYK